MRHSPAITFKVINISKRILNDDETNLLSRGLNFCPNRHFDLFGTLLDVNKFSRSLTLKKHYFDFPSDNADTDLGALDAGDSSPPSPRLFTEVCALQDLVDLASKSGPCPLDPTNELSNISFKLRSDFYPVASRGKDLDLFPKLVVRDLTHLAQGC